MSKILVIRFSSIGDIVLTSPVIRCLKMQLNKPEIHVLTKDAYSSLFEPNPYVDKVFTLRKDQKLGQLIRKLKIERYDYVIDLHKNIRSYYVRIGIGARSASFPKLNFKKYLIVRFKWNLLPKTHIVDRYFKAVKNLGVTNDSKGLDFFIAHNERFDIFQLPPHFQGGYHAVVIGGQHFTKIFPAEKLIRIIPKLELPVILLGGAEDTERAALIVNQLDDRVLDMTGKISLGASATIIQHAVSVLTNDTGLMHIAAAFRKPIVSLWGNTLPDFGMYPYMPGDEQRSVIIEHPGLSCRPCSKIGFDSCPKGHFKCMMELDEETIATQLKVISQTSINQ
ncbi:MAG: glycosyltransferase family 9 protein [Bacteroidales bacterium]|nr:glycosyltransferase family 9 protein [Bacteroidales bacterium]